MSKKTDMKLEEAFDRYYDHFGTDFPLSFGKRCPTEEELIRIIDECISNNKAMPEPEYNPDFDY